MISLIYTILCKPYTYCVNLYTHSANSSCFVANLPIFRFTCFGVKFWPRKLRSGKSFDKYNVWLYPIHRRESVIHSFRTSVAGRLASLIRNIFKTSIYLERENDQKSWHWLTAPSPPSRQWSFKIEFSQSDISNRNSLYYELPCLLKDFLSFEYLQFCGEKINPLIFWKLNLW